MNLEVRIATLQDEHKLLEWRNDKDSRQNSFSKTVLTENEHKKWLENKLNDVNSKIIIASDQESGHLIGMVRFDIDNNQDFANISINIDPKWRGKKVSSLVLDLAIDLFAKDKVLVLAATIGPANIASQRCFERSGFSLYESGEKKLLYLNKILIINGIENVRSNNNVNWMNLMRLAFRVAPREAEEIFNKVNEDDGTISELLKKLTKSIN